MLLAAAAAGAVLTFDGCAIKRPAYIGCKGDGSITETFNVLGYAQSLLLQAKCGDGFSYEYGPGRSETPPK